MKRRTFIKLGSLGALPLATGLLAESAQASQGRNASLSKKRIVVLVELRGGNDGLNTLIPFTDPLYYKLRPNIAIPKKLMLPINKSLAMHPSLRPLQQYWQRKEMAWLQGVGYPHSNRSHFRSTDIWNTASNYNHVTDEGWIANLLGSHHDIAGLAINTGLGPFSGSRASGLKINDINAFVRSGRYMKENTVNTSNNSLTHLLKTERIVA